MDRDWNTQYFEMSVLPKWVHISKNPNRLLGKDKLAQGIEG